ncbi:hypothetical protein [Rhodovarius crocodyli]|uniref:hypothetical protein n=1 Tax=Rhodovarius crocodyli TaxID=1979269 RepID=UPI000FD90B45|nr:hypothetical protein [Rhodovarius crocodyli]
MALLPAACAAGSDAGDATREALTSTRASLVALGQAPEAPPSQPAPRRATPVLRSAEVSAREASSRWPEARTVALPVGAVPTHAGAMMGSSPERVMEWLGEPELRRMEGPVAIWLYTGSACQLDILFYPTAEGLRAAHVQARAGSLAQRTETACLRDLAGQARRRASPAGALMPRSALPAEAGA